MTTANGFASATINRPVDSILTRLSGVRPVGEGRWEACCPAHDDNHASLSIAESSDGTVLINCHAGCDNQRIVGEIDLKLRDLFPVRESANGRKRIVATYDYHDADGTLVKQKVRYAPKQFVQRRPDHDGGWIYKLGDCADPLYRLPELLSSSADVVFVVEGEKDVERIRDFGATATCNAGGAGKWRGHHSNCLRGRSVCILPDNDGPGRKHANQIAESLINIAASVKVVELPGLPEKGDVSDFISQGGTIDAINTLCGKTAEWQPGEEQPAEDDGDPPSNDREERRSTADKLVELALNRYRIGRTDTDEAFAVAEDGPNVAIMFRGSRDALRAALSRGYRAAYGRTPNGTAIADALMTLQGESYMVEPESVHLRVAEQDRDIVIDLGDSQGRAVVVSGGGWQVVDRSPVLFRRTAATGALPVPERGGKMDELMALLNVSAETWPLVVGWSIAALVPNMPHPILMLGGQQGTGKTSGAKKLIGVIDPSPADLRSQPRDPETWAISAAASWVVGVDNISHVSEWWSDSLCKAVTGDGWLRRKLYTDGDLSVISFRRVILLTSIDAGALRGDLGDRVLLVDLEPIGEATRRAERDIDHQYKAARPRIFGALLDLLAKVWKRLPDVQVDRLPRMADFARLLAALDFVTSDSDASECSQALNIYLGQKERIAESVVESDGVAMAVADLIDKCGKWEGTAAELLTRISPERRPKGWPGTPQAIGGRLRRLTPALGQLGITVRFVRSGKKRLIHLSGNRPQEDVTNVTVVTAPDNTGKTGDNLVTRGDECDNQPATNVTAKNGEFSGKNGSCDISDECDNQLQTVSSDTEYVEI